MRVIAGKFGSRRLRTLRGMELRPSSDRLRETLFNVLSSAVQDSLFVDAFAGTGAVGIEALSRCAREVVFIESRTAAAMLIRKNLDSLDIKSGAEIMVTEAIRGFDKLAARHVAADFIFLDPPYIHVKDYLEVMELLGSSRLVAPRGIVIAEHSRKMALPARFENLERSRLLEQGDSALSFYRLAVAA